MLKGEKIYPLILVAAQQYQFFRPDFCVDEPDMKAMVRSGSGHRYCAVYRLFQFDK